MATKSSNRPGVCRCCLAEGNYKDLKSVFYWMGEKEIYYKMLEYCFDITLSNQEDTRGRYSAICELCISRLRDCVEFKKQVLTAEESFTKALDDTFGEGSSGTKFELAIKDEHIKKEMAIEPYGSDEERGMDAADDFSGFDDDLPYEPSEKKAKMSLKVEDGSDGEEVTLATLLKRKSQPMNVPKSDAKNETVKKTKAKKTTVSAKKLIASTKKTTASAKNTTAAIDNAAADETESTNTEAVVYTPKDKSHVIPEVSSKLSVTKKGTRKYAKNNEILLVTHSTAVPFKWTHHKNYICICCDKNFLDPKQLKDHTNEHEIEAVIEKLKYTNKHSKLPIKIDISDLKCRICLDTIPNLTELQTHLISKHEKSFNDVPTLITPYFLKMNSYVCAVCKRQFDNFVLLNTHMSSHFSRFVCHTCGTGFPTKASYNSHQYTHGQQKFACNECDKVYNSPHFRERHIKEVHKGNLSYKCPHCQLSFRHYVQRQRHIVENHNGERPACKICGRIFLTKMPLYVHMRKDHYSERKHVCKVCEKGFFDKQGLRDHMASHTNDKNFECKICKKSYSRRSTLNNHLRWHKNE